MSAQENKEFIRRYLGTLSGNPKPPELVDQFVAEQPLKDHIATYESAFPGYEMEIEKVIAEDELVSVIGRARGTQKTPFMGMPSMGKSFDIPIQITYHIEAGKIINHWMVVDTLAFMQQLGFIPSAEGTG